MDYVQRKCFQNANIHNSTQDIATSGATSSDQLDAYFKGSNAVNTAAYFTQMQGAYPGMSYHGNDLNHNDL